RQPRPCRVPPRHPHRRRPRRPRGPPGPAGDRGARLPLPGGRPAPGRPPPPAPGEPELPPPYVVVHPGASAPARTLDPAAWAGVVAALAAAGWRVVVTGGPDEGGLGARGGGRAAQGERAG